MYSITLKDNRVFKISGAIFDVDGTILDSMGVWGIATTSFYKKNNLLLTDKEAEMFQHMTLDESLPYIKNTYSLPMSVSEIESELKELIKNAYEYEIAAKPYVSDFIKSLHSNNVKIAIATSGYVEFCKAAFSRLGISKYISSYALSSEVGVNKSNPDIYLLAAERIGIPPEKCMVFEDISTGISGAKSGGFLTCAVKDKSNLNEIEKLKSEADIFIDCWSELL